MTKVNEIFLPIKGYEGLYEISNFGNVKTLRRLVKGNNNSHYIRERIRKSRIDKCGYKAISLRHKSYLIHRLVAIHFIPNPENKPTVNHLDGNKGNCYVENLEWATQSENIIHSFKNGMSNVNKGEKCNRSILKEIDVIGIKSLLNSGKQGKEISKQYNVTPSCISDIKIGNSWKHLK